MVLNADGGADDKELTRFDITNKSLFELKQMGFTSVFDKTISN